MPNNDLASEPHPGPDKTKLSASMGGLVEVHKIHVNRGLGDFRVELGMELYKGFSQNLQPGYPHFGRGESMHPAN